MLLLSPYTESFALETPQKVPPMYVNTNAVSIIYAWVSPGPERTAGNRSPGQFFMTSPKRHLNKLRVLFINGAWEFFEFKGH